MGHNNGAINASYATGGVSGGSEAFGHVGGLVGLNSITPFATIRASYATGRVSGISANIGGLVGLSVGSIHDSYFDTNTSGQMAPNAGQRGSSGVTTVGLRSPTAYTGIYANWNVDLDDDDLDGDPLSGGDDPWDFGPSDQYPVLQVDFDGDGIKSWEEFGPQFRPGVAVLPEELFLMEGEVGTYTVVLLSMPTTRVMVTPGSDNTTAVSVSGELTFMPENWDTAQTVTASAVDDMNTANEVVSLRHTVASGDPNYDSVISPVVTVRVTDNGGIRVRVRVFLAGPLR